MRRMKQALRRGIAARVASALLLPIAAACAPAVPAAGGAGKSSEPVRVGVILPLTGAQSVFGTIMKNGFDLALEEVNQQGVLGGRKIELVIEDSTSKAEVGKSAAEKLIQRDKVPVLIGEYASGTTFPILAVAEQNKTPIVVETSSADNLTQQGYRYTFRIAAPSYANAAVATDYLEKVGNVKTAAIAYENGLFGTSTAEATKAALEQRGLKVLAYESYDATAVDLKPMVTKLKATNADAAFLVSYLLDAQLIMRQARELDWNPSVFLGGSAGFSVEDFVKGLGPTSEYVASITWWAPDVKYPGAADFATKYTQRFGQFPDYQSAEPYVALKVVADAVNRAGAADREKIRQALEKTDMKTTMFGPIKFETFDVGGKTYTNQNRHPLFVRQVQDGKFVTVFPEELAAGKSKLPTPPWTRRG